MGVASRVAGRRSPRAPLLAAAALAVLSLAACARVGGPAPVVAYGAQRSTLPPQPVLPIETVAGQIVVQRGDTLYAISRRTNAPLRALIDANNLHPPYALQAGQRLTVPHVRAYRVQPGDTLSAVARRYGVGVRELVDANALTPPYGVRVGQVLVLPYADATPRIAAAPTAPVQTAALPAPAATRVAPAAPPSPVSPSPPPQAPQPAPVAALPMPPAPVPTAPAPAAQVPAAPAARPMPEPASLRTAEPPAPPAEIEPARGSGRFLWPVRGSIVSDFGSKPGGLQNDGINIAARRGTPIRAAADGVVVYAGNELRGFGNLLLIKHSGGWVTAYAHAETLVVRRGQQVKRGQIVGRVGNTGSVTAPQLHFEVRRGSRPVNPRDYLGPQTASAAR